MSTHGSVLLILTSVLAVALTVGCGDDDGATDGGAADSSAGAGGADSGGSGGADAAARTDGGSGCSTDCGDEDGGAADRRQTGWIETLQTGGWSFPSSVVALTDGTLLSAGAVRTDDFLYLALVRLDARGGLLWQRAERVFETRPQSSHQPPSVESRDAIQTADGDFVQLGVAGTCADMGCLYEARLSRYAPDGTVRFERAYGSSMPDWNVGAHALVELSDASLVFADSIGDAVQLVRVDADGVVSWAKTLGPTDPYSSSNGLWWADDLVAVGDDMLVIGGHQAEGGTHGWVARLDADGALLAQTAYDGPGSWNYTASAVASADGSLTIVGAAGSVTTLLHLDPSGAPTWAGSLDGLFVHGVRSVEETRDGFVVVGSARIPRSSGLIAKLSRDGALEWQRVLVGSSSAADLSVVDVAVSNQGAILVTGEVPGSGYVDWLLASLNAHGEVSGGTCPALLDSELNYAVLDVQSITVWTPDAAVADDDDVVEMTPTPVEEPLSLTREGVCGP